MSETTYQAMPKFSRSATLPNTKLPPLVYSKTPTIQESPNLAPEKPLLPLASLTRSDLLIPPEIAVSKDGPFTPRTQRIFLNEKILTHMDRIINDRPTTYKIAKDKPVYRRGFTSEFDGLNKDRRIQELFEAYRKFIGVEEGMRDKLFDSKFDIFREVKTFIDARKLFQEDNDSRLSPVTQQKSPPEISTFLHALKSVRKNSSTNPAKSVSPSHEKSSQNISRGQEGTSMTADHYSPNGTPRNNSKNRTSIKKTSRVITPIEKVKKVKDEEPRELTLEEKRKLEIRELYGQLKDDAIEKFGPGIFDKAKKRLKDPEQVKYIEKRREQELALMRKMKEELGNFDIGAGLINSLNQQGKGEGRMHEEPNDKYSNFMEKQLSEESVDESYHGTPLPQWDHERFKQLRLGMKMGKKKPVQVKEEEDPQMVLIQKAMYLQEKGDQVFKTFRTKIAKANNMNVKHHAASQTQFKKTNRMHYVSSSSQNELPPDSRPSGAPSIVMHYREPATEPRTIGKGYATVTGGNNLFAGNKPKFTGKVKSQDDLEFPQIWNDKIFGKTMIENKIEGDMSKVWGSKKMASITFQKSLMFDICHSLANLSTSSRQLNQELQASIREMDGSYAKKAKTLRNLDIPESLQKPVPKSYVKNKVTATLAGTICRTRKFE